MKKLLSSVLLLLGFFSFVSSSLEVKVSAAVVPPSVSIPASYVAPRAVFDVISPDDELVLHMMEQIADVDPRFNNLSQYESLAYFITIDTVKNDYAGYMWERDMIGGYKFYIMPHVGWSSTLKTLSAEFAPITYGSIGWDQYSTYGDAYASGASSGVLNAHFALDWSADHEAYVFGYTFDADGVLDLPISRVANNVGATAGAFRVYLYEPLSTSGVSTTSARALVVRGNLGNMPSYYRIPALDDDLLNGDGGDSGDDDSGLFAWLWNNIRDFFTGLWNGLVDFLSPAVDVITNIIDLLVDMFIGLFVPDQEYFIAYAEAWDAWLHEKFGALYESIVVVGDVLKVLYENRFLGDTTIELGELFGGRAYIDYGVIERELPSLFVMLQLILQFLTGFTLLRSAVLMFVSIAADKKYV